MPLMTISASVTVPSEYAPEARESLDRAIDQLAIRNIPIADSEVEEECADPPEVLR